MGGPDGPPGGAGGIGGAWRRGVVRRRALRPVAGGTPAPRGGGGEGYRAATPWRLEMTVSRWMWALASRPKAIISVSMALPP